MNAASILAHKGADVITAAAEDTIEDAARILTAKNIGAVVILDENGMPAGVLSERDITAAIGRDGALALTMRVSDCMSREVLLCQPADSLDVLMGSMTDRRIRHLPVVEGGRLLGVVSIGDVVKQKIAQAEAETQAMKAYIAS